MKKLITITMILFTSAVFAQDPQTGVTAADPTEKKEDIKGAIIPPTEAEQKSIEEEVKKAHSKKHDKKAKKSAKKKLKKNKNSGKK